MPRKANPKKPPRYPWGAERPGVVEKRFRQRIADIPIERQKFVDANQEMVQSKLAEFDAEEQKLTNALDVVQKHREAIRNKNGCQALGSPASLGGILGYPQNGR